VGGERSFVDVLQDIARNVNEIIRSEVRLAQAEMREEATKAVASAGWLIAAAVATVLAVHLLLWSSVYALALIAPLWAAALAVAAMLAVTAGILFLAAKRRFKRLHVPPGRTVESIKESASWVRESIK
jgi:Flp pilus assembly protein TadB